MTGLFSIPNLLITGAVLMVFAFHQSSNLLFKSPAFHTSHFEDDNDYGMTVEEFQKKVSVSNKIVLVFFHADWCKPCIKLKPEIVALGNETKEYCELLNIDTDANPKIAEHFEINSLPMFVIYKNGKKSWENIGLLTKAQVKAKIDLFNK
jgi:thioredoxin 1